MLWAWDGPPSQATAFLSFASFEGGFLGVRVLHPGSVRADHDLLDTAFQRVRRTDAPLRLPVGLGCYTEGIELTFSDPLDPEIAKDPESYSVQVWDYDWSQAYGSPEVKPSDPTRKVKGGEKNRDDLKVLDAELSPDGKTVFLRVAGMQTCMQMRIGWNLDGADGELVEGEIHNTIHFLPTRAVGTR